MNKAFTREDAPVDEDDDTALVSPLPPGARNYMTPGGHARLKRELDHLVSKERPELVATVAWAAGNGDRSENGDYIYGKKRLREIDRRIRFLVRRLDDAEVVDPAAPRDEDAESRIYFGATVTVAPKNTADSASSSRGDAGSTTSALSRRWTRKRMRRSISRSRFLP